MIKFIKCTHQTKKMFDFRFYDNIRKNLQWKQEIEEIRNRAKHGSEINAEKNGFTLKKQGKNKAII